MNRNACLGLSVWALSVLAGLVAGCDDGAGLGKVRSIIAVLQDWDADGVFEQLPVDPDGQADRLLDFSQVVVKQRLTRELVIQNDKNAKSNLEILQVHLATDNGEFSVDQPHLTDLAPGKSTLVTVGYSPQQDGPDEESLIIHSNDPDHQELVIRLTGEGVSPDVQVCVIDDADAETCNDSVAPENLAIDLGERNLNQAKSVKVLVRNTGVYTLTVAAGGGHAGLDFSDETKKNYFYEDEWQIDTGPWTGTIEPGAQKIFTITHTPIDGGVDLGELLIQSDDPDENVVMVEISGAGLAPKMCPEMPPLIHFGSIGVGHVAEKTYRITSCGTQTLNITTLTLDSGNHGFFTWLVAPALPVVLDPGEVYEVQLRYAPATIGAHSGVLDIASNDPLTGSGQVNIFGESTPVPTCDINVVPGALDFGQVSTTGFSSKPITMQNVGDANCTVSGIEITAGAGVFSVDNPPNLPLTIYPGDARGFTVRYQPDAMDADTGTLNITTDDDPDEGSVDVPLAGTGVEPPDCDFQADPALLNFGSVPQGTQASLTTQIWNFGKEDCFINGLEMAEGSDPSFTPGALSMMEGQVDSGAFMEITVFFEPQSGGLLTGELIVQGGKIPFVKLPVTTVALSGGSQAAQMCLNPETLDFGPVAVNDVKKMSFAITACGPGHLKVRQIAFEGANPDFTFASVPGVPRTIPAGQSYTVEVQYSPSEPGSDFGRIVVSSNAQNLPDGFVELRGNYTGTCPAVFDCQPSALYFPNTDLGQSSDMHFTCVNHGSESLTVNSVQLGGGTSPEFSLVADSTPKEIDPGEELYVEVSYIPSDIGYDTGSIAISSSFTSAGCDNFTLVTVPLEGEGQTPDLPPCIQPKVFQPTLEFAWPGGQDISNSNMNNVFMTPIVVNLTDDNADGLINEEDIPDIVFSTHKLKICLDPRPEELVDCIAQEAILRAISGDDGHAIWTIDDPRFRVNYECQLAAADIDGDNLPEIIASKLVTSEPTGQFTQGVFVTGNLFAFEHTGAFKWESEAWHGSEDDMEDGSAVGVADLDHDGHPEIFRGASVFDRFGRLMWEGTAGRGATGHGVFCTAADLDMQGGMELVCGNTAYRSDGSILWQVDEPDGVVGIADFNLDGLPEVLLFSVAQDMQQGLLDGSRPHVINGQTGAVLWSHPNANTYNAILPPVIADIDDNGRPEVGFIGMCQSEEGTECFWGFDVNPSSFEMTQLWEEFILDTTMGGGNSAFDFEGDGPVEVLQNDEHWVNIYAGRAHDRIYHAERFSATGWELPLVVDVDNDAHAEIIVIQNGGLDTDGILVYGNVDDDWVATRRIWNQFDFHITNIRENATVPRFEVPNWTVFNNYLVNEKFCE